MVGYFLGYKSNYRPENIVRSRVHVYALYKQFKHSAIVLISKFRTYMTIIEQLQLVDCKGCATTQSKDIKHLTFRFIQN